MKNFENYLNEQRKNQTDDFKVGDIVFCVGQMSEINFKGEIGKITRLNDDEFGKYATIIFENNFNPHLFFSYYFDKDVSESGYAYNVFYDLITHIEYINDLNEIEKRIRKRQEEEKEKEEKERLERIKKNKEEQLKWWELGK